MGQKQLKLLFQFNKCQIAIAAAIIMIISKLHARIVKSCCLRQIVSDLV